MTLIEQTYEAQIPAADVAVVIRERIVEEESQRLEQWLDFIRRRGVPADGKMLYGTAFLKIIREVLRNGYDLVMAAASAVHAFQEGQYLGH